MKHACDHDVLITFPKVNTVRESSKECTANFIPLDRELAGILYDALIELTQLCLEFKP